MATAAKVSASAYPSSAIATKMNRKFTERVPVIPGRLTRKRDAKIAIPI